MENFYSLGPRFQILGSRVSQHTWRPEAKQQEKKAKPEAAIQLENRDACCFKGGLWALEFVGVCCIYGVSRT